MINTGNFTVTEWLFTSKPKLFGLVAGYANPTGIILAFIILIMFVCSLPFVRRGGSFEVFYWTHLLYIPFWILLIFHGPNFWKWFIIPGTIFVLERLMRLIINVVYLVFFIIRLMILNLECSLFLLDSFG